VTQFPPELSQWTTVAAVLLAFAPVPAFGFCGVALERVRALPRWLQVALPAVLAIPYVVAAAPQGPPGPQGWFRWGWFALYALLPVVVAALLMLVARLDPDQRGHWLEFLVLLVLGLAVDLRWFEGAWPRRIVFMNKLLLLDAGLYGFLCVRRLSGVGFDLRLRWNDWKIGLREWAFYTPIAVVAGLALGFLHWHGHIERPRMVPLAWIFTFFFIALPEEIYFRGWMQNLLERRLEQITDRRVGRAWRAERRIGASAITHATVDTVWGALLR
jgi:uncharacterized protein